IAGDALHPIQGSTRTLLLGNTTPPFFLASPAEVGFTPSGSQLLVTTKTHSTVDVFAIGPDGRPSAAPVKNPAAGVPFAFVFDSSSAGEFLYVQSGLSSSVYVFRVGAGGTLTQVQVASVPDGASQEGIAT